MQTFEQSINVMSSALEEAAREGNENGVFEIINWCNIQISNMHSVATNFMSQYSSTYIPRTDQTVGLFINALDKQIANKLAVSKSDYTNEMIHTEMVQLAELVRCVEAVDRYHSDNGYTVMYGCF